MKNLFLSALMLTGVVAFAQEPATQTQSQTTTTTTTQQPAQGSQVKPADRTQANQSQPSTTATQASSTTTQRSEATLKEEKTTEKKAEPAKRSN